ncbi:MAG TPA: N-acetylmuramic acid 6-phosphate etherase [Candidatus Baltobacteraceae bacterium]|jgi:N-acetylmuramic acid 6-phosphate etherase|nr:N-acetylmuramic acid 6-phosphate etherase [Candidatus Baltobacteraceae bacterium]
MSNIPQTELRSPNTFGLDEMPANQLVRVLAGEHGAAVAAVLAVSEQVAQAVNEITVRLRRGGRLHYVGAGTSGRIGYLDASEMPPTFGTDPSLVCAHIAGGIQALTRAIEGAEDDRDAGVAEMREHVRAGDAVLAISASGTAPFVVGAVTAAREQGAWTLGVSNSPDSPLASAAEYAIVLATGPEPLTGSTRMLAGTSQKILLNTISTATMVMLGKVYDNLMVDVVATNKKLRGRALRLVTGLSGVSEDRAREVLDASGGSVKAAVVMAMRGMDAEQAKATLHANGGSLRASLHKG